MPITRDWQRRLDAENQPVRAQTQSFNPINYGFEWTKDGWYDFDHKAAHKAARQARDAAAKSLRRTLGKKAVTCHTNSNQLMSRGGIGSSKPHIEVIVNVYRLTVHN